MKKAFAALLVASVVTFVSAESDMGIQEIEVPSSQIMSIKDMKGKSETALKAWASGVNQNKTVVFKIAKGEKFPANIVFDATYLSLVPGDNYFVAKKDFLSMHLKRKAFC